VRLDRRRQIESLQKAELERAYAASRLAVLSAQLQPHFLFNSLHAISELIEEDSRRAGTAVAHLGDFLRYALAHRDMLRVELAAELKGLEAYLALQQVRFGEGLTVDVRASPESLAAEMPPLLLQPLAENAIEHGRRGGQSSLFIRVSATSADGCLTIVVHNSQPRLAHELTPAGFGLGLTNVATRLRAVYGDTAHLRVGPDERGGTSATLHIPVLHRRSAADETT
jgi:LytS/YehU family sensor histidine kinase